MASLRLFIAASAATLLAAACTPYNPDLGQAPFKCGASEPKCPDDYSCVPDPSSAQGVCKADVAGGGVDGGIVSGDGGTVQCNDDSDVEPNDTITDATIIPIPDFGDTYQLRNLAICGPADVDIFRFRVDVSQKNALVDVSYNAAAGGLVLDILNSTGVSIFQGTPMGGNANVIRAEVANLSTGNYFAKVQSAAGLQNNYGIDFAVTGP